MAIANVTLNNTFDEWRTVTNQLITFVNEVDGQQLINAASNTAVLTVTPNKIARNQTLYISLNVSSSVLDTSTLNVATANAVNIVFAALANTDARLILVSDDANTINAIANAALIQANTARIHANAAHSSANAGMAIANGAFVQANTARVHANTAHASANAGMSIANAAFASANAGQAAANAALIQANTARVHANTAHATANAGIATGNVAFIQANTARDHANAAFLAANVANTISVANTLSNGMTQIRSTRTILNFVPSETIVTFIEDDVVGNRINVSSQVVGIGGIGDTANLAFVQANASFNQANTARIHANTAHASANAALASANAGQAAANAGLLQANTARIHANIGFEQANTARVHANASFLQANLAFELASAASGNNANTLVSNKAAFDTANAAFDQANTSRIHANTAHATSNAAIIQANTARVHANAAFSVANVAMPNTAGASFAGNLQIPTGNLTIGLGTNQGIRLFVDDHTPLANVSPQIRSRSGTQFIQLNANTSVGSWNDLILDRDLSIIFTKGLADDGANLVIGPWTDSSFGYKQDGEGRHGFNTSNPRHVLDANGTANISGSLLVGAMNVVPTVSASFAHANAAFLAANTGLGLGSAFNQANTARVHANTAHASANAGLAQANTARDHANAAFLAANTGLGLGAALSQANTARDHANVSFAQANTARSQANDAYTRANTGVTVIQTDALNATRYIVFTDKTTGTIANANVATSLSYNPSSGAFVATSLKSSALYDSSNRQLLIKDAAGSVVWGN